MNTQNTNEQKPVKLIITTADLKHQPGMAVASTEVKAGYLWCGYNPDGSRVCARKSLTSGYNPDWTPRN